MRTPNDIKLAENCNDIDIILGGHDHVYEIKQVNNKYIIKSGTDFRQFSKITINLNNKISGAEPEVTIEEINVTSEYSEDAKLKEKLDKFTGKQCLFCQYIYHNCLQKNCVYFEIQIVSNHLEQRLSNYYQAYLLICNMSASCTFT